VRAGDLCTERWRHEEIRERLEKVHPGLQDKMRYADGGILDQQPLGRALETLHVLVRAMGPTELHRLLFDPDRRILFIEPDPPQVDLRSEHEQEPSAFDNLSRSLRLWSLSSSPQFAVNGEMDNNRRQVRLLSVVADLAEAMARSADETPFIASWAETGSGQSTPETVPPWLGEAIERFYAWLTEPARNLGALLATPTTSAVQQRALKDWVAMLERLRDAYLRLGAGHDGGRRQATLRQMHLDLAGRLGIHAPWTLVDWVSPPDPAGQLWGEQVVHFGGFLSARFLRHDYQAGRAYANHWLTQVVPQWANPTAPVPPAATNVGITPWLLLGNTFPLLRMGRRLLRDIGASMGLGYRAATAWSHILSLGAAVSLAAGLAWLWNAWSQMLFHGSTTDPLVVQQPLWIMWGMSAILFLLGGFVVHTVLAGLWRRLRALWRPQPVAGQPVDSDSAIEGRRQRFPL
jgi:hypothetical protein